MDKSSSSTLKWIVIALAAFFVFRYAMPFFGIGGGSAKNDERQPFGAIRDDSAPTPHAPEQLCTIHGARFDAALSSHGASLRHFQLTDPKYTVTGARGAPPIDLVSTKTLESRMPLRTDLRVFGADPNAQQVPFDDLDWKLTSSNDKSCTFTYDTPETEITKTVAATGAPFQLSVETTVTNKASDAKAHRFAVEQDSWRTKKETEGHLGRVSEWMTKTDVKTTQKVERHSPGDFDPSDFKDKEFTAEKWRRAPGEGRWASVSSSFFASAVIDVAGPAKPAAEDQIEERWDDKKYPNKDDDPNFGHLYRARLAYPEQTLKPGQSVTYKQLAFVGPKERSALAAIGGGKYDTTDLLDMGWFAPIGKVLVQYVYFLYGFTKSWGWAIVLLTITVKLGLFPLSLSQIKSSIAMRRLKPEMDAINEKYKGDATQRGLALQELWRKNKVANPVTGCVPMVLQMPIWFALYTALQTAVELYHVPFGPLITDLSAPDRWHIIPFVLGASSLLQQRIMPPQGDPQQQKMMMWMMPGIYTVMMFFLPAGLGVYMLTNTWLGIGQQLVVERYLKAKAGGAAGASIQVREKDTPGDDGGKKLKSVPVLGKGNARARG